MSPINQITMLKTLLSAVLLSASLLCIGCKNDDDDPVNCNNWAVELQAEVDAVTNAANAWAADLDNTQKCNAYKTALQAYVNALAGAENCATQVNQHAEWQAAIDATQTAIDNLQC
jgi:hypothetical protein